MGPHTHRPSTTCVMVGNSEHCCLSTTQTSFHTNDTLSTGKGKTSLPWGSSGHGSCSPESPGLLPTTLTLDRSPNDGRYQLWATYTYQATKATLFYFHLYFNARQTGWCRQYSSNFLVLDDPQLSFTCSLNPALLFKSGST